MLDISRWNSHSGPMVCGGLPVQLGPQQPQPLHRVDRVHRHLQRQVHVVLLQQHERLVDDQLALVEGERAGAGEEVGSGTVAPCSPSPSIACPRSRTAVFVLDISTPSPPSALPRGPLVELWTQRTVGG